MVRRKLAARLRLGETPPAGCENDRAGIDVGASLLRLERGDPANACTPELTQRVIGKLHTGAGLEALAESLRDRVTGTIAHLQQALPRRAAAAGEPIAAVRARELDAQLLEPVDRRRR